MSQVPAEPDKDNCEDTLDGALGSLVKVYQPRKGYRFSLDSLLLARFVETGGKFGDVVELGSGCGVVSLCLGALGVSGSIRGLELQADMVRRARRSAEVNGLDGVVSFIEGDLRAADDYLGRTSCDCLVTNPPFRKRGTGRLSPRESDALSRHEIECSLKDVVRAAKLLLKNKGDFYCIYPVSRLEETISECADAGIGAAELVLVHPRLNEQAKLFLLHGKKDGNGELKVLPPLELHDAGGDYTAEAKRLIGSR